jgi:hypothetical protein
MKDNRNSKLRLRLIQWSHKEPHEIDCYLNFDEDTALELIAEIQKQIARAKENNRSSLSITIPLNEATIVVRDTFSSFDYISGKYYLLNH